MAVDRKLRRTLPETALADPLTPIPPAEDTFLYALSSNNAWAGYKAHQNPNFFPKLESGQTPQIRKFPSPTCPNGTCHSR